MTKKNNVNAEVNDKQLDDVSGGSIWKDPNGIWHAMGNDGSFLPESTDHGNDPLCSEAAAIITAINNKVDFDKISTKKLNRLRKANGYLPAQMGNKLF